MSLFGKKPLAKIAFNLRPRHGPYGGGNQWASQLVSHLRRCGYKVVYRLDEDVDLVMGTHAGLAGGLEFSYDDVVAAKHRNPRLRCIQRINDNDARKTSRGMDSFLAAANRAADHTVFVSRWLRAYHSERWFHAGRPGSVITNGADPSHFHPLGNREWRPGETFRLVTHHWSDNPAKGFDVYARIDEMIASGLLPGVELHVIGRWPSEIRWRAARTHPPCTGRLLGEKLRGCHAAVTASRYEPGAMHPVEALQCGLPLLYTAETGGTVELGERFGIMLREDFAGAIGDLQRHYATLRKEILMQAPDGDSMCNAYRRLIQAELASRP